MACPAIAPVSSIVADYLQALDQFTITSLRNLIGGMNLAEVLTSGAVTGTKLRRVLS